MNPSITRPYLTDIGLLLLRLALGVVFVGHGLQKVMGNGVMGPAQGFEQMGIPAPALAALYATWVELLGGAALILGVLTPIAGILVCLDMLGALFLVHIGNGLFVDAGGFELVLVLGAGGLAVALAGSGRFGVDALFRRDKAAAVNP